MAVSSAFHTRTNLPPASAGAQARKHSGRGAARSRRSLSRTKAFPIFDLAADVLDSAAAVDTEVVTTAAQDVLAAYQEVSGSTAVATDAVQLPTSIPNGVLIGGAAAVIGFPVLGFALFGKGGPRALSAAAALDQLAATENAVLVDLRPSSMFKEEGSPDVRGTGSRVVRFPLDAAEDLDSDNFAQQFGSYDLVVLLDAFGSVSQQVGKAAADMDLAGKVCLVSDGAEGARGWRATSMPWREPSTGFSLPGLGAIKGAAGSLVQNYTDDPSVTSGGLAVLGALGLGTFVFTEYEAIIEVVGTLAFSVFFAKKLLFFNDRKRTLEQVDSFLRTKKAPADFVEEVEVVSSKLKAEMEASTQASLLSVIDKPAGANGTEGNGVEVAPAAESQGVAAAESKPETSDQEEVEKWIEKWKTRSSTYSQ